MKFTPVGIRNRETISINAMFAANLMVCLSGKLHKGAQPLKVVLCGSNTDWQLARANLHKNVKNI